MDKSRKNKEKLEPRVVRAVAKKYDLTYYYVSQCVQRRRDGIMPDTLRKELCLDECRGRKGYFKGKSQFKKVNNDGIIKTRRIRTDAHSTY